MTRKDQESNSASKKSSEEDEIEQIEEEFRGHKLVCTCADDPRWCEKCNFGF